MLVWSYRTKVLCAAVCLLGAESAWGQTPSARELVAYAREYQLEMLVGQYDLPSRKWIVNTAAFTPPAVRAPFTLFGPGGKIALVDVNEEYRTRKEIVPWDWGVAISSWGRADTHVALALSGEWSDLTRPARALPLNDPAAEAAVSAFLTQRRLQVTHPRVTQVLQVDLNGNGQEQIIVCANSDNAALTDDAAAVIYSLSLLRTTVNGKTVILPLRTVTSRKPARRSIDEHERLYGRLGFFQVLALSDIDKDGREEIAILNDDRNEGPEIDLYSFAGDKMAHLLEARKVIF